MNIEVLSTSEGEVYASVGDLLLLLKDAKEHPEKYNEEMVTRLAEEILGKREVKPAIEKPF
jgi:hypothetical protein